MLSIFVLLIILFASATLIEHGQVGTMTTTTATTTITTVTPMTATETQTETSSTTTTTTSGTSVAHTVTLYTNTTSTSTTCINTGGIGCPHFFNQTYTISVGYTGPWGVTYQGYLGVGESGTLEGSGSFYGHAPTNESVTVSGTDTIGITLCAEAQKLDASNSTLVLRILPPMNVVNQTSFAYGTTKTCLGYIS